MLDRREEWIAVVGDAQPVDILRERAVERQNQAVRAVGQAPVVARAEVLRAVGHDPKVTRVGSVETTRANAPRPPPS